MIEGLEGGSVIGGDVGGVVYQLEKIKRYRKRPPQLHQAQPSTFSLPNPTKDQPTIYQNPAKFQTWLAVPLSSPQTSRKSAAWNKN